MHINMFNIFEEKQLLYILFCIYRKNLLKIMFIAIIHLIYINILLKLVRKNFFNSFI